MKHKVIIKANFRNITFNKSYDVINLIDLKDRIIDLHKGFLRKGDRLPSSLFFDYFNGESVQIISIYIIDDNGNVVKLFPDEIEIDLNHYRDEKIDILLNEKLK